MEVSLSVYFPTNDPTPRVDLDGDVVENLIDFTYTGTIELTLLEVQAMLVAANQLKFITVIRVSSERL